LQQLQPNTDNQLFPKVDHFNFSLEKSRAAVAAASIKGKSDHLEKHSFYRISKKQG
jgi:hypothetical protein